MASGQHDTAVGAQDDLNLILKQPESEQVSLEPIYCDVNGFLIGGVAKHNHHHQADDQRNADDDRGGNVDSKRAHRRGKRRNHYSMYPSPCSRFLITSFDVLPPSLGGSTLFT